MKAEYPINANLIELVRTIYGPSNFILGDENDQLEIIPKDLEHRSLLNSRKIEANIIDYYFLPCMSFLTDDDFKLLEDTGYIGRKENTFAPYPIQIYGAFFHRIGLWFKLKSCLEFNYTILGKPVTHLTDLAPYFFEYSKGFKAGFDNFIEDCITPFLTPYPDKQDFVSKVFEFITKEIFLQHNWLNNHRGFKTCGRVIEWNIHIESANDEGKAQGYFYRAWSIVLSSNELFAPLFRKFQEKRMESIPTLSEFVQKHTEDALQLEISNYGTMNQVLQHYKSRFANAEFDDEKREVQKLVEKAITNLKGRIQLNINNGSYKATYIGHKPHYLWDIRFLLEYRELLPKTLNAEKPISLLPNENYKSQLLFQVGLLFANGKMSKYFTIKGTDKTVMKEEYTAPKIASELGDDRFTKYILATINNYTPDSSNGNKNVFNRPETMRAIIRHCGETNIKVDNYFLSRLPNE